MIKKLVIIGLLLLLALMFMGTTSWDSDVVSYFPLDQSSANNRLEDEVGGYHGLTTSASMAFSTTITAHTWSKGAIVYATPATKNFSLPLDFNTAMNGFSAWSIEFDLIYPNPHDSIISTIFDKHFQGDTTNRLMYDISGTDNPPHTRVFFYNVNNFFLYDVNNYGNWTHYSVEWTGSVYNVYRNGSLVYTQGSQTHNPFADTTHNMQWMYSSDLGYGNCKNIILSDIIISKVARGGAQTLPTLSTPGTPTFTATPTLTVTQTVTQTITETVTETVTQTITQTITQTVTETVTPTVTPTVTQTVTQTITPTVTQTITPTYTVTPTITVTYTITPTPQARPAASNVVIGYRIERTGQAPRVVYKNSNYLEFITYDAMYGIWNAIKPNGIILKQLR